MEILWQSKHPHTTCWLKVTHNPNQPEEAERLAALKAALEAPAVGFERSKHTAPPLPDGERSDIFIQNGSDIFNGWTPAERETNLKAAHDALFDLGYEEVYFQKLEWQDLI